MVHFSSQESPSHPMCVFLLSWTINLAKQPLLLYCYTDPALNVSRGSEHKPVETTVLYFILKLFVGIKNSKTVCSVLFPEDSKVIVLFDDKYRIKYHDIASISPIYDICQIMREYEIRYPSDIIAHPCSGPSQSLRPS